MSVSVVPMGVRGDLIVEARTLAQQLALQHVPRAVARLAELMECDGRQAQVAAVACKALIDIASGDESAFEDVTKLSDEQLLARRSRES